ncbi:hypothetical protein HOLleu_23820 [Holothuria leucospilota]|uniref:Uncharacterized protein n=1 Tax=Holothuria leucospilota TaxID=206669 RepID=A0A9Q1BVX0_HOLLE|nr:hypothetical protein HOLleu_23820 [Holothuria leucospilota]
MSSLQYDQCVLLESHEVPSREYLRDFLLKNSCESCSILMEQFKVRKTLQENKYLANNLCDTICEDFFPKTIQCKECHQWVDCRKMLDITETLSENHMKSVYHILNSTAGCKDCTCYDKDTDNSSLRKTVTSECVAAKSRIMDAIKDCWDRALKCKVCHTKLIHLKIPQSEGNTEEKDRLKTFIRNHLKQFEFRLQCEVCEGFFVPKNPIVLEQLPLGALKISTSGCSKAEDVKKFQQAASDQLKEHVGSLEDTFVYPSENKNRTRYSSGNVKPREAAAGEATKCETSSDEVTSNVGDVKPTLLPASDQLKVPGDCCLEGELCDKRRNHGSGKSQQGGISGERSRDEDWMRQISKPNVDEDTTRSEPCLTQSTSKSAPPDGDEDEVLPPKYARCYSKDDLDESEGIAEAVGILQEWGKAHNVSLCILKNYRYGNLEGILKEFRSTITKSSGDFDILVLSRHLGVILVEMKATQFKSKKQLKRALRKAQDQLNKNKMVLFEINKDWLCPPRVPVISLIAVPNITCQQLQDNGICQRDRQRILSKCMIEFLKTKPKELDKVIGIPNLNYAFNDYEYYSLMARFLSLNNLIKYHCTDEGLIRDTGKKMLGMLLTEAQKSLIQSGGNPFQILAGDYGTGKSLMLTEKAKVIANAYKNLPQKKKIMLISCTDITVDGKYLNKGQPKDSVEHLRNFIGESATEREFNYFDHIEFHMIRSFINGHSGEDVVEKLEAAIAACASSEDTELHLLFDEIPLKFMRMFKPKIESLLTTYKSVIKTFWVSIATHSFRVTVLSKQDPEWIKDDRPANFEFRYLRKNLRVPGRVLDLQKAIEWFNGDGHVDTRRGDIPLGPMPLLYRVPKCVCPSQSNSILTCECSKFRVKETLRRLFIKIGFLQEQPGKSVQSEKVGPSSITMLLFAVESQSFCHDVCKVLSESCKELLIHVEDRTYIRPDGNGRSEESSSGHYTGSDGEEFITGNEGSSNLHSHTADGKKCCSASSPGLGHCQTSSNHKDIKNEGLHREESHSNQKIVLTTETSFIGCESEVLICVDLNGMLHWYPNSKLAYTTSGISRCLSQYIHLTWMPSEAEQMFREQMEVLIQDGDAEREDTERAFRCKETCLERVLNQILIEEQMVEMPKFVQE